jgi:diphthamide synthase subunit DPH2
MNRQELIEQWVKENKPTIMEKTLHTRQRVDLIKELIESPSEQQHKLVEFEIHYITQHQKENI